MAADHASRLTVLGTILKEVHHIGSMAVPGLAAKPVIDLMPLVSDLGRLDQERSRIEALDFRWRGEEGIPVGAGVLSPVAWEHAS